MNEQGLPPVHLQRKITVTSSEGAEAYPFSKMWRYQGSQAGGGGDCRG